MQMNTSGWLCVACGVEYGPSPSPPDECAICEDERQYVPPAGQRWTTLQQLRAEDHTVSVFEVADRFWGLCAGEVGIEQQAALIQTEGGNLLFDVPGLIDDESVSQVRQLGGIAAIVASHPHMYGAQSAWSAAFDDAPIWIAEADQQWVGLPAPSIRLWSEPFEVLPGILLDQVGGHFPGSTVAIWSDGADGRGVLLAGDAIFPVADGNVTFLRSYPNRIPMSAQVVERIAARVDQYKFDVLFNNFGARVGPDARAIVNRSARRYADWVSGRNDHLT